MPIVKPILTPIVFLASRLKGAYGVGEVISLNCQFQPRTATLADFGGAITWRVFKGGGAVTLNDNAGLARYTAPDTASEVMLIVERNDNKSILARSSFKIIAPNAVNFSRISNVLHRHGRAGAGFLAALRLLPAGVSYQNIEIREGSFKSKGTGSFAAVADIEHPTGAWGVGTVEDGNHVVGVVDRIDSGVIDPPFEAGTFEWNIPWQYRVLPAGSPHTFSYIVHHQEINAIGHVSITKGGVTVEANVNDHDEPPIH